MCIFGDHSMIIVEKGKLRHPPVLKEYKIGENSGVEICKLEKGQDESAHLVVVERNENIIIIVCSLNETVQFIKIVPA